LYYCDGDGIQNIDEVRFGLNATLNDGGVAGNFEGLAYDSLGRLSTATAVGGAVTHVGLDNEGNIVALSH
jgi:YD repeat-containing protein